MLGFCAVQYSTCANITHTLLYHAGPRMAEYQNVRLEDIDFRRALFGFFPTYRESPLQPGFDRVMQIGDASGIQVCGSQCDAKDCFHCVG